MKTIARYALVGSLILGQLAACQNANTPDGPGTDSLRTLSAPTAPELAELRESDLPEANSRFGFELFQQLLAEKPQENLFVSPLSVSIALSMLYPGTSGDTRQEIANTLHYDTLSENELHEGQLTLRKRLQNNGEGVEVLVANALWGREGVSFNPAFVDQNQRYYGAQLAALDFSQQSAIDRINQWASDNTRGLIPKVVERIDSETLLLLMNAIYFKGDWSTPFEVNQTASRTFSTADNRTENIAMMNRYGKWRYGEVNGTQVVSLPYGEGKRTEMLAFLPPEGTSLEQWSQDWNLERWTQSLQALRSRDGRVVLPKFKAENTLPLKATLSKLGMVKAFSESEAELDRLLETSSTGRKPYVSDAKQDAVIEVNEQGTEAAAVTTITVGTTSAPLPQDPFEMILDRPFAYAIYDQDTESILFMGAFNTP